MKVSASQSKAEDNNLGIFDFLPWKCVSLTTDTRKPSITCQLWHQKTAETTRADRAQKKSRRKKKDSVDTYCVWGLAGVRMWVGALNGTVVVGIFLWRKTGPCKETQEKREKPSARANNSTVPSSETLLERLNQDARRGLRPEERRGEKLFKRWKHLTHTLFLATTHNFLMVANLWREPIFREWSDCLR